MIDGEPLVDFYCRASIMLYEIELQEDSTGQVNKLLYCFVSLLSTLADFHQSLEKLREYFNLFFRQPNNHRLCFKYTLKEIYEDVIIPKGLVDTIDFSSKFRHAPVTSIYLPSPIVNAGKMTKVNPLDNIIISRTTAILHINVVDLRLLIMSPAVHVDTPIKNFTAC